jgi:hypothetical protein
MWQPREPPLIVVDASFILDRWRPADGPALRRFDLDPDTARFFGYSVEQADVSYNVTAELRGQGIAPPRAQRAPRLGCEPNRSAPCPPRLSRRQRGFPAGRGKVRVRLG